MAFGAANCFWPPCKRSLRQICSLLPHLVFLTPMRHCGIGWPALCASKVSLKRFLVKGVFFTKMRPPLMRPCPFLIQSSSDMKTSFPALSSSSAIRCKVLWSGRTRAASASNIMTCVNFSGLCRYSANIRCFSQLKFSRCHSLMHRKLSKPRLLQPSICQPVSCGSVAVHLKTSAWPCFLTCARLVAKMDRSQRGRKPRFLPHSAWLSMSTA
mmetsp:Transcript_115690/g.230620  ORF Transcript_115690/g.230620 Transcript_115690/m.230620 type:complete len:212 (+) Transcript_115690:278-913(+)